MHHVNVERLPHPIVPSDQQLMQLASALHNECAPQQQRLNCSRLQDLSISYIVLLTAVSVHTRACVSVTCHGGAFAHHQHVHKRMLLPHGTINSFMTQACKFTYTESPEQNMKAEAMQADLLFQTAYADKDAE